MQLGITIPMERFFRMKKPPYGEDMGTLFCWDLHVVMLQGRPSLIGVNCGTRFSFILADIRAQNREDLLEIIHTEIEKSLSDAGISKSHINTYIKRAAAMEITKTHGRSPVAYLNKAVELVMWNDFAADSSTSRQPVLNDILNRTPTKCTGDSELERPMDRMLEKLEKFCSGR